VAPKSLAQLEPVEAWYDASGSIKNYLAINHPALDGSGNPVGNIPTAAARYQFRFCQDAGYDADRKRRELRWQ